MGGASRADDRDASCGCSNIDWPASRNFKGVVVGSESKEAEFGSGELKSAVLNRIGVVMPLGQAGLGNGACRCIRIVKKFPNNRQLLRRDSQELWGSEV